MLSDADMRARMVKGWKMGLPFTVCGNGSLPSATENIRKTLPKWCEKYQIQTVSDAGAGDMKWMAGIVWDVTYRPFDLLPRSPEVREIDITAKRLPKCDLIVCRMVLNHLDAERIDLAIAQFRKAGKYLAATQFDGDKLPKRSPEFTRLDLRARLGEPIERVQDGKEAICSLALWRL
jgi:hypothetical protein